MNIYELTPVDHHKSFYGKAIIGIDADGGETLYSYGTPILTRTAAGELVKLWDGWTATTGRHIAAFCGLNKTGFTALEYQGKPTTGSGGRTLTNTESYRAMIARRTMG